MNKKAPENLSHSPIIAVNYEKIDQDAGAGDAKFLSLGYSTWTKKHKDPNDKDYSAKVFRKDNNDKWARQSEELPLWRVLDLAILLVAVINDKKSNLNEFVQNPENIDNLKEFVKENMALYSPKIEELKTMLETSNVSTGSDATPNIFDFATSELSQDAMFAWLIQWADIKYAESDAEIHNTAQLFLRLLLGSDSFVINTVEVGRQWKNIDVWAKINNDTFLIIEDKTNTSTHDNQLERYRAIVEAEYKGMMSQLYYTYVKTGNEPFDKLKKVESVGYHTVSRSDIIHCLEHYKGNNALLINYRQYLIDIEQSTQSFKELPVSEWGWYAWQGFYKALEKELDINSWDYVANPSGGFLGAWWYFKPFENGEMYLQFEEKKLCFKIYYDGDRDRSEVRWEQYKKLIDIATQHNRKEIKKPSRFGAGSYMTIAVVNPDYLFGDDKIDMKALISKLKDYQALIDLCCS